jgi:hypothetical protein
MLINVKFGEDDSEVESSISVRQGSCEGPSLFLFIMQAAMETLMASSQACFPHPLKRCNSSVNRTMSMFKLSITSRWALMAARGWARLILDRRRDLINDRLNRATAAEAPLDGAQERYHFDNPTTHTRGAYYQGEAA